jgi:hypothetical protein
MTAKFEAFKSALETLCIEHGVYLHGCDDDDYGGAYLKLATDEQPAGLALHISDDVPPTPEEREAFEERYRQRMAVAAAERAAEDKRQAEFLLSPAYLAMVKQIGEQAANERKQYMRVSTDPTDPAYIDERPRRAWVNDVLIEGWVIADEFRRCVITLDGKVHNGAVLIERLPDAGEPAAMLFDRPEPPAGPVEPMLVKVEEPPVVVDIPVPAKTAKHKAKRRR